MKRPIVAAFCLAIARANTPEKTNPNGIVVFGVGQEYPASCEWVTCPH